MKLSTILSIPYVLQIESLERTDGKWICRAAYPELPECVVEDTNPIDAIDSLEEKRLKLIFQLIEEGKAVPVPRAPLTHNDFNLTTEPIADKLKRLGLVQWLEQLNKDVLVLTADS